MANDITVTLTASAVNDSPLTTVLSEMQALGPKSVKTKEFEAEQFDPEKIHRLLGKNASHPTFNNMTKVQVCSNRAKEDC
jgi:hypothetical protein